MNASSPTTTLTPNEALTDSSTNADKHKRIDGMIWFDPPRSEDEVYKR